MSQAYVKGVLPPAPKPTLPPGKPEWKIKKDQERHERSIGSAEKMKESRDRGREVQKKRRNKKCIYDHDLIYRYLDEGYTIRKTAELVGCGKSAVLQAKKKREESE